MLGSAPACFRKLNIAHGATMATVAGGIYKIETKWGLWAQMYDVEELSLCPKSEECITIVGLRAANSLCMHAWIEICGSFSNLMSERR